MKQLHNISIADYDYDLPIHRIAKYPLPDRDQSKLLICKDGVLTQDVFQNIDAYLPSDSLLLFNETKVVQARLIFYKESGARVEIFCLEAVRPTSEVALAFQQTSPVVWKCFIGNSKKWKQGSLKCKLLVNGQQVELFAQKAGLEGETNLIEFSWQPSHLNFSQILESAGMVPLPPYLNREAEKDDKFRYQTIYAQKNGSVAAPTAGLHFTDEVFQNLSRKDILTDKVVLHVGAGTFKPVLVGNIADHEMHSEKIVIQKSTIKTLLGKIDKKIIVVGTTTVRTLESLYWFGVKLKIENEAVFKISQWDPYQEKYQGEYSPKEILEYVLDFMAQNNLDELKGETELMILPGYDFKITDILITNFHQPKSTLLLLVSALIGEKWKLAYNYAMENDFRFLSYGDSCLFFNSKTNPIP
jgi:S-adenosylmethionine:tRNA ribosyltransferase-isomerase